MNHIDTSEKGVRRKDESEDVTNKRRERVFQEQLESRGTPRTSSEDEPTFDKIGKDPLGDELAEHFLYGAETGRHMAAELNDEVMPEEEGGPFTFTTANRELGGEDEMNPPDAEVAPLPSPMRAPK